LEVHVYFAVGPLKVLVLLKQGPWRKFTEQGRFGAAFPGEGLAGGEGKVGEKDEELESYLWVAVARRERV